MPGEAQLSTGIERLVSLSNDTLMDVDMSDRPLQMICISYVRDNDVVDQFRGWQLYAAQRHRDTNSSISRNCSRVVSILSKPRPMMIDRCSSGFLRVIVLAI